MPDWPVCSGFSVDIHMMEIVLWHNLITKCVMVVHYEEAGNIDVPPTLTMLCDYFS